MPNWCYNRVEIYGEGAEKIADKISSEETSFDFAKIIPEPDYDKIEVEPTFEKEDSDFRMPTWWDWRVQNWELNGIVPNAEVRLWMKSKLNLLLILHGVHQNLLFINYENSIQM